MQTTKPAIFLDRDGVIIHNKANYIRSWDDVYFYPFSLPTLKKLAAEDLFIFIITNQSPIGRGILSEKVVQAINLGIRTIIEDAGGRIDHIFYCPHAPQQKCNCRKPLPGMILQAVEQFPVDLQKSWLIGDAISDIQAGINAGISNNILLKTGRGNKQFKKAPSDLKFIRQKNLKTAIESIINR